MTDRYPVYTEKTECQDCYKCLLHCPAKAIRIENGSAAVIPERCVACGTCVLVCPSKAKHVRDDLSKAVELLESDKDVYAALAPSWSSEFLGVDSAHMVAALKKLGFKGVSETALGAQMVSQKLAEEFPESESKLAISSACPAASSYIRKYLPELANNITDVLSPALAHCNLLRSEYGDDIAIVFISPCIAKKTEADEFPGDMNVALTYVDLHNWFKVRNINPQRLKVEADDDFVPQKADDGLLYPVEGGMLQTLRARGANKVRCVTISGLVNIDHALRGLKEEDLKEKVFVEVLACDGGCINGPCMGGKRPGLLNILAAQDTSDAGANLPLTGAGITVSGNVPTRSIENIEYSEEQLRESLARVGKYTRDDELNCGGCGYDCCRSFAAALIEGRAEPQMCVNYLRKMAQRKANALLRCMPTGVVIVDSQMHIIESNKYFVDILGGDALDLWEANPGLEGANASKLLPFVDLIEQTLNTGRDIKRESVKVFGKIIDLHIFIIDPGQTAGAILVDVTNPGMKREKIADKARQVIKKNLETVQSIAAELGENMAETEILLRSLAEDYSSFDELEPENTDTQE